MNFDANDIIAVANSRYMKRAGNKLLVFMVALIVVGFGGAYMSGENSTLRWVLSGLTVACVLFAYWAMDKGQKKERDKLLKEWEASKKGELPASDRRER